MVNQDGIFVSKVCLRCLSQKWLFIDWKKFDVVRILNIEKIVKLKEMEIKKLNFCELNCWTLSIIEVPSYSRPYFLRKNIRSQWSINWKGN